MLFTDQRFCITPPYRTARPGRLISPTNVAAVICHALSPGLSQLWYGSQVMCLRFLRRYVSSTHRNRARGAGAPIASPAYETGDAGRAARATLANTSAAAFRHLSRRPSAAAACRDQPRVGEPGAPAGGAQFVRDAGTRRRGADRAWPARRRRAARPPPSVLAKVTSMQSLRAGDPLVSANAPEPDQPPAPRTLSSDRRRPSSRAVPSAAARTAAATVRT